MREGGSVGGGERDEDFSGLSLPAHRPVNDLLTCSPGLHGVNAPRSVLKAW